MRIAAALPPDAPPLREVVVQIAAKTRQIGELDNEIGCALATIERAIRARHPASAARTPAELAPWRERHVGPGVRSRIAFDRVGTWTVATVLCSVSPDENPRFKTLAHRAGDEGLYEAYASTVSGAVKCHAHALACAVSKRVSSIRRICVGSNSPARWGVDRPLVDEVMG